MRFVDGVFMDKTDESVIHKTDKRSMADNLYGLVAAMVIMIALIVGIIVGTLKLVPYLGAASSDVDRQIAYVSDGVLYYVRDMTVADPKPMHVAEIENATSEDILFSADGRFLYFMTDISASGVGNLCRIQTSSIRHDENINKGCIEVIQKGVREFSFVSEEFSQTVLTKTQKSELCLCDGTKVVSIAKNCVDHELSQNGVRVFFYTKTGDVGVYNIRKKTSTLLAAGVKNLWSLNAGDMYYTVKRDSLTDICMIDVSEQKTEPLVKGCSFMAGCDEETDDLCYVRSRDSQMSLYNVVDDLWTDEDYSSASGAKHYFSDKTYDVFDLLDKKDRRYYRKHKKKLAKFYEELPKAREIIDIPGDYRYLKKDTDGHEEIFLYDAAKDSWHEFDMLTYEEAVKRAQLKVDLQNESFVYREYDIIIRDKSGTEHVVAESVSPEDVCYACADLVFYKKAGPPVKLSMDDVKDISDVHAYLDEYGYEVFDEELYATVTGSGSAGIEGDVFRIEKDQDSDRLVVYTFEDVYGQLSFNTAYYYALDKGALVGTQLYPTCSGIGAWSGKDFYYTAQDALYVIEDGNRRMVLTEGGHCVYRYEYGLYLALKTEDDIEDTLFLVTAGGEWIEMAVGNSFEDYTLIYDDQIVFLMDDGLYVFRGSDRGCVCISENVTAYTCFGIEPEFVIKEGFY